jgi:hypothetical protein
MIVRYTWIPVKLKILKLFIRELSNILEGNGTAARETVNSNGVVVADEGGWESDDDDDDDEDWDDSSVASSKDTDTEEDILKGVKTKVSSLYWRSGSWLGLHY